MREKLGLCVGGGAWFQLRCRAMKVNFQIDKLVVDERGQPPPRNRAFHLEIYVGKNVLILLYIAMAKSYVAYNAASCTM